MVVRLSAGDGPLTGLRVAELSVGATPAAVCGRVLADLGADVVKTEGTSGEPVRVSTPAGHEQAELWLSGKRSLVCDGGPGFGAEALARLLRWADVVVADEGGLRLCREAGIDPAAAAEEGALVCAATYFGRSGPLADLPGGEHAVQAATGTISVTGTGPEDLRPVGVPVATLSAGMVAACVVLACVHGGYLPARPLDIAAYDVLFMMLGSTHLPVYLGTGKRPQPRGSRHTLYSPWDVFGCKDGFVQICTTSERQWRRLTTAIGRSDLAEDEELSSTPGRLQHADRVAEAVSEWSRLRTKAAAVAILEHYGVPCAAVNTVEEAVGAPPGADDAASAATATPPASGAADVPTSPFASGGARADGRGGVPPVGDVAVDDLTRTEPRRLRHRSTPPLHGLKVVEMGMFTAGPLAGRLLAGLGAEVTKVEPPRGCPSRASSLALQDRDSFLFEFNNTDKRSRIIDPSTADGPEALNALVGESDVLLENFTANRIFDLGLREDVLGGVTHCSITGFGWHSPRANLGAYDTIVQALSGIMALTGGPQAPVKAGPSIVDQLAAFVAATGIIAALHDRQRTGRRHHVDIALADVGRWMAFVEARRRGASHEGTDVASHPVRYVDEAARHPHTSHRRLLVAVDSDGRELELLGYPGGPHTVFELRHPAPRLRDGGTRGEDVT